MTAAKLDKSASFPSWDNYKVRLHQKKLGYLEDHTLWVNGIFRERQCNPITNLSKSITDGTTLVNLLEILGNEKIPGIESLPVSYEQKVANLKQCVSYLDGKGVETQGLIPTELAGGNLKSTLMLMNNIRKKYDPNSSRRSSVAEQNSFKLIPSQSSTSLNTCSVVEEDLPAPPPPPPPPRSSLSHIERNNMIGRKMPPPPPLPPQAQQQGIAQPDTGASEIIPGILIDSDDVQTKVDPKPIKVTLTELDSNQVSQMGPEGHSQSYQYQREVPISLRDRIHHSHHPRTTSIPPPSPGPPSRVVQAWQNSSNSNNITGNEAIGNTQSLGRSRPVTYPNTSNIKSPSLPSVQDQLNHLLNGENHLSQGLTDSDTKGTANGAFQHDSGELLVIPPPKLSENLRNQSKLSGFPTGYQPSITSDNRQNNTNYNTVTMKKQPTTTSPQITHRLPQMSNSPGPPQYRPPPPPPKYQPPPQYSPVLGVGVRMTGSSDSSVFTSGSGNSTPAMPPNGSVKGPVSSDLRNAWNKLYGPEPKSQNTYQSQNPAAEHPRQNSILVNSNQNHVRSSPMGQSSSPRSHSSSSQGGISPNETHPPQVPSGYDGMYQNVQHNRQSSSNSLDNTKSSSDSFGAGSGGGGFNGHVNLAYQGHHGINGSNAPSVPTSVNRYPEDKFNSQPQRNSAEMINYIEQRPKTPTGAEQRPKTPSSFEQRSKTPTISNYEQQQQTRPRTPSANVNNEQWPTDHKTEGLNDQRPKTPVLNQKNNRQQFMNQRNPMYGEQQDAQRSKTPTEFNNQRPKTPTSQEFRSKTPVIHEQRSHYDYHNNNHIVGSSSGQPLQHSAAPMQQRPRTPVGDNRGALPSHIWNDTNIVGSHVKSNSTVEQQQHQRQDLHQRQNSVNVINYENVYNSNEGHSTKQPPAPIKGIMNSAHTRQKSQEQLHAGESIPMHQLRSSSPTKQLGQGQPSHLSKSGTLQKSNYPKKSVSIQLPPSSVNSVSGDFNGGHNKTILGGADYSDSDRSVTPPLPPLSPDNTPPFTPPESPSGGRNMNHSVMTPHHVEKSASSSQHSGNFHASKEQSSSLHNSHHFLPSQSSNHTVNTHTRTEEDSNTAAIKGPALTKSRPPLHNGGRRAERKASHGHSGVRAYEGRLKKTSAGRPPHRLGGSGYMLHHQRMHRRNSLETMSGSQDDEYVDDSEVVSGTDLDNPSSPEQTGDSRIIKQQLEGLESMYREILMVLGLDKEYLPGSRRSISSTSSISQVPGSRRYRKGHPKRELRHVNKRFQRLESHVVTLARSVAHLSSEMRSQNAVCQEIENIKQDLLDMRRRPGTRMPTTEWERFRGWVPGLTNPKRVDKLKQFFGAEPPLLHIFLKKLGYERYVTNFQNERITMIELPYLNEQRLEKIGIPMGPRLRILQEAQLCFRQDNFDIYIV